MKNRLLTFVTASALSAAAWGNTLPYSQSFDTKQDFETMTLLHSGEDTRDWDWSSNAARYYPGNRYNSYNAWFFTPGLDLDGGKTYVVTFTARISSSGSSNYKDLYVSYGTDCTIESQTQVWQESIQSASYSQKKLTITPETTGSYHIGFHTEAASGSMNDLLVDDIRIIEYVTLPGKVSGATAVPGEKGNLSVTLSWTNPSVNDGGSALDDLTGVKIYRTDSSWVDMTENNLVATVTDGITIGQPSSWTDTSISEAGIYYYNIVPFNSNGDSPIAADKLKTGYIGTDTGIGTTKNVTASAVEGNDKAVVITWDAPTGINGGYINPQDVAWKISRKGNSTESVVLEEAWTGTLPYAYTDTSIPGLDAYTYTVQYVYNGTTESNGTTSNTITLGGTAALPYIDAFDSALSPVYIQIPDKSWAYNSWSKYIYFSSSANSPEGWLITPPFELKKGVTYEIGYNVWKSGSYTKNVILAAGNAPTADALSTQIADDAVTGTSGSSDGAAKLVRFTPEEDGIVYFGFHVVTTSTSGSVYIDNISVKEVTVTPTGVTDFTATPDADGKLSVTLSWTNPALDNLGNTLEYISKIEVYRGDVMIKKYTGPTPGVQMTHTDDGIEKAGTYTYKAVAYLGENAGEEVSVTSGVVGGAIDLPYTADLTSEDGLGLWTMPTNASGDKWIYNASNARLESPDKDDLWLFTPQFNAKKGKISVRLDGATRSDRYKENVKLALYKESAPTAEAVTPTVDYQFASTTRTDAEFIFDVTETGKYYIGIHRPTSGWNLYIYGTEIEQSKVINDNAPQPVTDLKAEPDADDEKKVNLSWTNPTMTTGGAALEQISKIDVSRNGTVVATLSGEATSYVDTIETAGKQTYSVVAYNGEEASEPTSLTTGFIGGAFDLPYTADFSTASTFDAWNFPANETGKTINYIESKQYLETYSDNVTAESPALHAYKGKVKVSIGAKTSSYRYPAKLTLNLLSRERDVVATQEYELTTTGWSETLTLDADIPSNGKYLVQITVTNAGLGTTIDAFSAEQTECTETITIYWDNAEAQYTIPAASVDNGDPTVMTCYDTTANDTARMQHTPTLKDAFYIEIPANARTVKFLDADDTDTGIEFTELVNGHIYKPDGTHEVFNQWVYTDIDEVLTENEDTPVYFNLRGERVIFPTSGNVYIIVKAGKSEKIMF